MILCRVGYHADISTSFGLKRLILIILGLIQALNDTTSIITALINTGVN